LSRGAVRGAYVGAWGENKLNRGFPGIYGYATAGATWTIDSGAAGYGMVGLGIGSSRNDFLSGMITRQRLGIGVGFSYSEDCGLKPTGGIMVGSLQGGVRTRMGGSADIGIGSDGTVALGFGRGPVSAGILIDLRRLANIIPDNIDAIKYLFFNK